MAQNSQQSFDQIQPLVQQQIVRTTQRRDDYSQYRPTSIAVHTHNNIDSPAVNYRNLGNVRNYLISSTTTLTIAQILALHTTPIVLVPPPTLRSVLIVHSVTARLTYGATPYTGANNLEFRYTDGSGTKVTADIPSAFINSTSSAFAHAPEVTAEFTPIGGGSSKNGQIVVAVPVANPGGNVFTLTGSLSGGATSATLTGAWSGTSGVFTVTFSNGNQRSVTFTNGSTALTWSVGLSGTATSSITLTDANSTITLVVHYHVVNYQT